MNSKKTNHSNFSNPFQSFDNNNPHNASVWSNFDFFTNSVHFRWTDINKIISVVPANVSSNVKEILGYTSTDFLDGNITYAELISPNHLKRILNAFKENFEKGSHYFQNKPYQLKRKDGNYIWVVDFVSILRDNKNKIYEYQSFVVDISKQIEAEQQIIEHRSRMEKLYEIIGRLNRAKSLDEVYQITLEGAKSILKADRASVLIFGSDQKVHFVAWDGLSETYRKKTDGHSPWKKDEIHARPIFISDVEQSDLPEELKRTVLNEGIKALGFVPLIDPAGLLGKFMVYYDHPFVSNKEDRRLAQLLADNLAAIITRMQALEQALRSEEKYRSIFENISEGIYQTTYEGKFLTVNSSMAQILGYESIEELVSLKNVNEIYWDQNDRQRLIELIEKNGVLKNIEVKLKRKDGKPIWVLMNDRPIYDSKGRFLYYEGTILDITDHKKTQDEIKKLNEFQKLILTFASEYINVPLDQFDEKINKALQILGEFTGVDRVYLFDYHFDKGFMTNTHEWCAPGITPEIDNLQEVPNELIPDWVNAHLHGKMIHIPNVFDLPEESNLRKILEPQEIKTLITVPIMQHGKCIGFVGFDSVRKLRKWSENEITLLKLFAEIISNAKERKEKEETIIRREEQLRALINATPDIICFKDAQGRWLEANEADLKLFELENIDYRGKNDRELAKFTPFYKESLLTCELSDEQAWEKGTISRTEEIIPRPDGTVKIYDVIKVPVFHKDGSRKGLVVFGRDITALKATEKLLERQLHFSNTLNELAREIILGNTQQEILQDAIAVIGRALNLDKCLIFEINGDQKSCHVISQWTSEKLDERLKEEIQFPGELFQLSIEHIIKNQVRLESHSDNYHPLFVKEGSASFIHEQLKIKSLLWYPIFLSPSENYILAFNYLTTNHKWDQEEIEFTNAVGQLIKIALQKIRFLEEQQKAAEEIKRLATLVEQSTSALIITDTKGKIKYVNPAFEKMTGFAKEKVIGHILPILKSKYRDEILRTLFKGDVWRGRWINHQSDGSSYHEEVVIFPIRDNKGNIINFCKSARNIENEIKLEEQLRQMQKMEAIGQLAGGVAHDFNNLLTVINGYAELTLSRLQKEDPTYTALNAILEAGKRAANLTNQLLAFSRKQIVQQEIVNLNQVILNTKKLLRRLIGEDIQIEFNLKEPLAPILADRAQLDQILINLVVNARDAINMVKKPEFQKRINIATNQVEYDEKFALQHPGMRPGKYVVLMVSDNGVGMDEETRQRIFEPFFTTKEKGKGTGLGLSTVYGIVKQNNGTIYVYSEPDLGTTFKINWPVVEFQSVPKVQKKKVNLNLRGTETILLVEDDKDVRSFAEKALSNFGYKIHSASNGREALELVKKLNLRPDLLITDLVMPEMNGKVLAIKLQNLFPDMRVIYVSGYTDDHIVQNGMLEKGIHFIPKPYSAETLAAKVKEVFNS